MRFRGDRNGISKPVLSRAAGRLQLDGDADMAPVSLHSKDTNAPHPVQSFLWSRRPVPGPAPSTGRCSAPSVARRCAGHRACRGRAPSADPEVSAPQKCKRVREWPPGSASGTCFSGFWLGVSVSLREEAQVFVIFYPLSLFCYFFSLLLSLF